MKTRPEIRVRLPRVVHAGTECPVEVELRAKRPVDIRRVVVRFVGQEHVHTGQAAHSLDLISLGATLSGRRELPRGETRFSCRFSLPASMPPSYEGRAARTSYWIDVDVEIPWWPDARGQFVVHVARPVKPVPREPKPVVYSSNPSGPKGREPYVELSLTDQVIASAGTIVGAVALGNVVHNDYTNLVLGIVPIEILTVGATPMEIRGEPQEAHLPLSSPREGKPIPFRLNIAQLTANDASKLWRTEWRLQVRAERRFGRDHSIEVPITIVGRGQHEPPPEDAGVPTLGSARIDALWRRVAERVGLELHDESLLGRRGEVAIRIWREHRGRHGLKVFGKLEYPSLELHLDGGVRTGFRRLLRGDVLLAPGESDWERRHYVAGRERPQVDALWRSLYERAFTTVVTDGVTLNDFTDEQLVLELDDAGQTEKVLRRFAELAVRIAKVLPEARTECPPPAAMAEAVPRWQALADALGGTLDRATMAVRGAHEGERYAISTVWAPDGTARHTAITLVPEPALGIRFALEWSLDEGVIEGDLTLLSQSAALRFAELEQDCRALTVSTDRLIALLSAPLGDPEPARKALFSLGELADALRRRTLAYR